VSAFPPALPADVDDLSSIWANDWAAFRALNGMDTHWQRPGWTPGRRSYHWMLTFEDAQDVQSHVTACQRGLPADGLDLVEPAAVHLTLGRVGFTDELPLNSALAAAAAARQHTDGLAEFGLRIGPVSGSRGAVRFSVAPWSSLLRLHAALFSATRGVLGEACVMDTATFRPHISIAYARQPVPIETMIRALEPLRSRPGPSLVIDQVSLVRLERVDRSYTFCPIERIDLASRDALTGRRDA